MKGPRLCDWWLENRSKCSEPATHLVTDRHGAPWGFCDLHYPLRYYQSFGTASQGRFEPTEVLR